MARFPCSDGENDAPRASIPVRLRFHAVSAEHEELDPSGADLEVVIARLLAVAGVAQNRQLQLQEALDSRIVIEQAKGILAERHAVSLEEAFVALRQGARSTHAKLRDLAAEVTATRESPEAIRNALSRSRAATE